MPNYRSQLSLFIIITLFSINTFAQVDTLVVGETFKNHKNIKEGTSTYILYREMGDGSLSPFGIKRHTITKEGNRLMIEQEIFAADQKHHLETLIDPLTLETSTHNRTTDKGLESYIYSSEKVISNPELESINSDFSIELSEPTFNFEIDFEFMKAIRWNELKTTVINFYHPGGSLPPQYYTFTVEGSEQFALADGNEVDTWKIFTDYNSGSKAWFWVSKSTGEVVKQMQDLTERAGFKFIKLKTYPE